jgi:hypothetical protein
MQTLPLPFTIAGNYRVSALRPIDHIPSSSNSLQVSPNPVSGSVAVSFTLDHAEKGDLELYNLSGKLVEELQSN